MPIAIASAVHDAIPGAKPGPVRDDGQGTYTVPCNVSTNVDFLINGKTYTLEAARLAYAPTAEGSSVCCSAIDPSTNAVWLLGASFLQSVCTCSASGTRADCADLALDAENNQIGLAPLK